MNIIPPTTDPVNVMPEQTLRVESGETDEHGNQMPSGERLEDFFVAIEFTDAAGYRWRRDVHGHLMEVIGAGTPVGERRISPVSASGE
ncbi:hypothetical protein O7543_29490 [Solwaraspora sp. WMMA2080]|uniref:hypothetical protein n=1 Tax=unclassified Solwaraspora TaxID=2627926 RepID=UPI00248B438C|nr:MULTISPECIES: hypothetical protein [unclassified Solwaraspora]WBB95266.1 hypothetical protein O7553_17860 [Solwaraspora sp. WMMA2059]WBC20828.1 hypothetical protein O7543_29490 [Solwaraspora sp. WMMA2080]